MLLERFHCHHRRVLASLHFMDINSRYPLNTSAKYMVERSEHLCVCIKKERFKTFCMACFTEIRTVRWPCPRKATGPRIRTFTALVTSLGFQTSVVTVWQDKDVYSGRTDIEAKYNESRDPPVPVGDSRRQFSRFCTPTRNLDMRAS